VLFVLSPASAQDPTDVTRTTYGDIGVLDMPSARMADDGQLAFTLSGLKNTQRYNLSFQILPWLEGSFRYSHISHWDAVPYLYDRSFGMKIRLWQESEIIPEVSLGLRDILGTGAYAAEYVVASKSIGDFDFSAGLGWGRLSSQPAFDNPFGLVFPSFNVRTRQASNQGGTVDFGAFFHGPKTGVFGGAIWHTPVDNLDFLVEYSSDKYVDETLGGGFKVRLPVNAGLSYRVFDSLKVSGGWYYGSSYGLTLSYSIDPTEPVFPIHLGPTLPPPQIRPAAQQIGALAALIERSQIQRGTAPPRGPWVKLERVPSDPEQALSSLLMSESVGVHDVEIDGRTVLINARNVQGMQSQCASYARVVRVAGARADTIAVTDLDDPNSSVALCPVPQPASYMTADASGDAAAGSQIPARDDAVPDPVAIERKLRGDIEAQGIRVDALSIGNSEIWLYYRNNRYFLETEAAGRIARVMMADAPASIEIFRLVSVKDSVPQREFRLARSALERAADGGASALELGDSIGVTMPTLDNPVLERGEDGTYPRLSWSIEPGLSESFFDPNSPLQVQLAAVFAGAVELQPGLSLEGKIDLNIYNNFVVDQQNTSLLPHVRSDAALYYKRGINGIANLDAVYRMRVARDIFAEVKVGYLEDMFAGAGAQVLWRPDGSRFSIGADVYEVWQRSFDRLFEMQNYHVLTGHASFYYESPWYGLNFNLHVGRYLAGDRGETLEVTRRFSTGVEVGAFATFTNVPFKTFGEGSFDKGIIIRIPFEWGLPVYSASNYNVLLRSLARDGGQRLANDDSLYYETRGTSYGEITRHLDDIVSP
jgi:hypothetical protein